MEIVRRLELLDDGQSDGLLVGVGDEHGSETGAGEAEPGGEQPNREPGKALER